MSPPVSTQLQIFTMGLQGSGKTTTSICLVELLAAKWLNQDEFSHLGKGAKKQFMAHLSANSSPESFPPVLIVDRINTTETHRLDIFSAMQSVGVRVGICWNSSVQDCISRVKRRSFGHKSILPGANVGMIVARTSKEYVPISKDELEKYGVERIIEISGPMTRFEVIKKVLTILNTIPSLSSLAITNISDEDIKKAVVKAKQRESDICKLNASHAAPKIDTKRVNLSDQIVEGRYEIHFKEAYRFNNVFNFVSENKFVCKGDFHITLLYINRALVTSLNEKDGGVYHEAIKLYNLLRSSSTLVVMEYVAQNERVMAIKCNIIQDGSKPVKFFDVIPHISIAKIAEAQFRESNDLIQEVEQIKNTPGLENHTKSTWIDLNDPEPVQGYIRFARHGQ